MNMSKKVGNQRVKDQQKIHCTRKSTGANRPQTAYCVALESADRRTEKLAKMCKGDATKSSTNKSAPHITDCLTLCTPNISELTDVSANETAIDLELPLKGSISVNVTNGKVQKLRERNDIKLNQENKIKLMDFMIEGNCHDLTTRLSPRQAGLACAEGRMKLSSDRSLLGDMTTRLSPRQALDGPDLVFSSPLPRPVLTPSTVQLSPRASI